MSDERAPAMRLNFLSYGFDHCDGYGRYSLYLIKALLRLGVDIYPICPQQVTMPDWIQRMAGYSLRFDDRLNITATPPFAVRKVPGRHWLLTMTEGSELPDGWAEDIEKSSVERIIVPCPWNAETFRAGGVDVPVHVVAGGTEPDDFPRLTDRPERPYTFLTLADRGGRKGWIEVWQAFYKAFGTPGDTPDVRLVVKTRTGTNDLVDRIAGASNPDPRVRFWLEDVPDIVDVYGEADCFAIPSRAEGWGMPHREAAMMGIPVIAANHSGLVDGFAEWCAVPLAKTYPERIPDYHEHIAGEWYKADINELAEAMRWCYDNPAEAAARGRKAAQWLRAHQTWDHAAKALLALVEEYS